MRLYRRRAVVGVVSMLVAAGCLGDSSLREPFDLRIENRDSRPRALSVAVDRVTDETVYEQRHRLDAGERITEPAVVETPGRYRITATDVTADTERAAERNVELTTGRPFCGWFSVRVDAESVTAAVPRCPEESADRAGPDP
ncbi:hypothetical protein [Halohasta salina]|uniref:hypothetical protein n=1 Tax=Halohasta salina TaxID=2961621 RepID=UPI0020A525CC|nr:hypothetical protein [Halohasta salina]